MNIESSGPKDDYPRIVIDVNEDPEMYYALKMSIAAKFEVPPTEGLRLSFRHPEGEKSEWVF